jgi:tetratricopeptide (TPR) repeat protein
MIKGRRSSKVFLLVSYFLISASLFCFNSFAQQTDISLSEESPAELFNLGQDAQEKGDLKKAIELYERALKIFPEFPEAEYQRATAFFALNDLDKAEQGFRRAIELRQDWTLPMTILGLVLIKKNNLDEAEKILKEAIELDDQNPTAYSALAEIKIRKASKGSETLESLKEIYTKIKFFSEKAGATASLWAVRGSIERFMGDKTSAKNSLNKALQIDSKSTLALSELAELFLLEGSLEEAKILAETLNKIIPESVEAKILLARVYASQGETKKAMDIINALPASNPDVKIVKESIELESSSDISALESQFRNNPENTAILGRLCYLTRLSSPVKSVEYCQQLLARETENVDYAVAYAAALVQAKKFDEAIGILQKVLMKSPEHYTARSNFAVALFQLKRYREAKREYLWLVSKRPDSAIAYYFLAITQDNLGEYLDAIFSYQRFLQLADPEKYKLEIEKINFRLPVLQRQIKNLKEKE